MLDDPIWWPYLACSDCGDLYPMHRSDIVSVVFGWDGRDAAENDGDGYWERPEYAWDCVDWRTACEALDHAEHVRDEYSGYKSRTNSRILPFDGDTGQFTCTCGLRIPF